MATALQTLGAGIQAATQRTYMFASTQTSPVGIPIILAVFDAVMEEVPEYTANVTEHPAESGTEITDHIQLKNPTLRLKGTISNSPLDLSVSITNTLAAGIDLITSSQARVNLLNTGLSQAAGILGTLLQGGGGQNNAQAAADVVARTILLTAFQTKQIVDILTKRQRYPTMAIQRLSFPRDQSTGFQLKFEIDLVQVRIVSPFSAILSAVAETVISTAVETTILGAQAAVGVAAASSSAATKNTNLKAGLKAAGK